MRIAITSTPLIDTSSYSADLAKQLALPVKASHAKVICNRLGYQTLYDIPHPAQLEVRMQLLQLHQQDLKQGNVVCQDSVVEQLADWIRWVWGHTTAEYWQEVLTLSREIAGLYDEIHWLQHGKCQNYNGYAWLDRANAEQISGLIPYICSQLGASNKLKIVSVP